MPTAHAAQRSGARRWIRGVRIARTSTVPSPRVNIPAPSTRYGTCVCEHKLAATTSGINIRWSPHSTAHVASSTTIHASSGRYGFHGWVSGTCPYPRTTTASSAPTATTPFHPARRWPIHSAVAIAPMWIITVAASRPHDDDPSARYTGASR